MARNTNVEQLLVPLADVARRCGGTAPAFGGGIDFDRAVPIFEEYGLKQSDIGTDWAGRPAVTPTVAAKIVTGWEKKRLARQKAAEDAAAARAAAKAEQDRSNYLDRLSQLVYDKGYESVDEWLKAEGFETIEGYVDYEEKKRRARLGDLKPVKRVAKTAAESKFEKQQKAEQNMTPKERARLKVQREREREAVLRRVKAEFENKYPRHP